MKRWNVSLKGSPQRTVEAEDESRAVAAYKEACGIIATIHKFEVSEAPDADVAPKPRPENGPLSALSLSENVLTALLAAGLTNIAEVVAYAKRNDGLSGIQGVTGEDSLKVRDAILAWKQCDIVTAMKDA